MKQEMSKKIKMLACFLAIALAAASCVSDGNRQSAEPAEERMDFYAFWLDSKDLESIIFQNTGDGQAKIEISNYTDKEVKYTIKPQKESSRLRFEPETIAIKPHSKAVASSLWWDMGDSYVETDSIIVSNSRGSEIVLAYECYKHIEWSLDNCDGECYEDRYTNHIFSKKPKSLSLDISLRCDFYCSGTKRFILETGNDQVTIESIDGVSVKDAVPNLIYDWSIESNGYMVKLNLEKLTNFPVELAIKAMPNPIDFNLPRPYPFDGGKLWVYRFDYCEQSAGYEKAFEWDVKCFVQEDYWDRQKESQINDGFLTVPVAESEVGRETTVNCYDMKTGKLVFNAMKELTLGGNRLYYDKTKGRISDVWLVTPDDLWQVRIPEDTIHIMPYGGDVLMVFLGYRFSVFDSLLENEKRKGLFSGFDQTFESCESLKPSSTLITGDTLHTVLFQAKGSEMECTMLSFDLISGKLAGKAGLTSYYNDESYELRFEHETHGYIENYNARMYGNNILTFEGFFDFSGNYNQTGFSLFDCKMFETLLNFGINDEMFFCENGKIIFQLKSDIMVYDLATSRKLFETGNPEQCHFDHWYDKVDLVEKDGLELLIVCEPWTGINAFSIVTGKPVWSKDFEGSIRVFGNDYIECIEMGDSAETSEKHKFSYLIDPFTGKSITGFEKVEKIVKVGNAFLILRPEGPNGGRSLLSSIEANTRKVFWEKQIDQGLEEIVKINDSGIASLKFQNNTVLILQDDGSTVYQTDKKRHYPYIYDDKYAIMTDVYEYTEPLKDHIVVFDLRQDKTAWTSLKKRCNIREPGYLAGLLVKDGKLMILAKTGILCINLAKFLDQLAD